MKSQYLTNLGSKETKGAYWGVKYKLVIGSHSMTSLHFTE